MLTFVTANAAKAAELERLLGRAVAHQPLHLDEIQAVELEPVVRHKAAQAYSALRRPVLVEDTGLAFAAWNGLPGALIAWFVHGLGNEGLCRLLDSHRAATATTLFGYHDGSACQVFAGSVSGTIVASPRGSHGFDWDAIFQPCGSAHTFAELSAADKDRFSMRRLALEQVLRSGLVLDCA